MMPLMALREAALPVFCLLSGGLGAIAGSFLGVVAERVPQAVRGEEGAENLLFPGSHCAACDHELAWWENIPLLSWCVLRGRCRCCKTAIPARLMLMEGLSALFFATTAAFAPSPLALGGLWLLWCGLLPLAVIDLRWLLLPDCLTQPLLWAGLLYHAALPQPALTDALCGAVAGYLSLWLVYWTFRLLTGREGLGYGDFKLLAALGAWCSWQALPALVMMASVSGIFAFILFRPGDKRHGHIPFGPCLALAGIIIFMAETFHFTF